MFETLKRNWKSLKAGRPGSRFQEQYERQRESQTNKLGRVARVAAGIITLLLGLFFLPAPGPGFIVVALGALLIAREFEAAARFLDWLEVRSRRVIQQVKQSWRRSRARSR